VLYRKKMGFGVPLTHWFRGHLKSYLRDTLLSEKSLKRGLVKPEIVTRLVHEHTNGERDHVAQVWTLLMLELWFRQMVD
ncbi:MAG: asparagine synthase C-terminal domain-containing protein, partial [Acidobacteriota bacterium]|nr:asparagine synthase C-terminal domain-containing protein [Acidobacteriota bacterium]